MLYDILKFKILITPMTNIPSYLLCTVLQIYIYIYIVTNINLPLYNGMTNHVLPYICIPYRIKVIIVRTIHVFRL